MVARYGIAVGLGALVTVGVLFTMHVLIVSPRSDLDKSGKRHFVDFVRVPREETVQRKDLRPKKPASLDAPPPMALAQPTGDAEAVQVMEAVPPTVAPMSFDVNVDIKGLGLEASDSEYLPMVRIEPVYPLAARQRGIEGHCRVEFTVTAAGTTKDVRVIDAKPAGIFNKASIKAAEKFQFKPKVVNGVPIEVPGVQNLFTFKLTDR